MSSPALMIRLISASVTAAQRAGQIIRAVRGSGELGIVQKGYDDPQTEADRRAQRCIVGTLQRRFPAMQIVGEEVLDPSPEDDELVVGGEEECEEVMREQCPPEHAAVQEKDVVVWVDPLDATKEFTQGILGDVTVLVGVAVGGTPVAGVIHYPYHTPTSSRTIWALTGLGVRGLLPLSSLPARVPEDIGVGGDGPSLTVTRSHYYDRLDKVVKSIRPRELLKSGGCGNKIMLVLEGRVDAYAYPSVGTKKWDTCAGEALLRAVGGTLTDVFGRTLDYSADPTNYQNSHGLLVTMRCDHGAILAKIPDEVKEELA